MLAAAREGRMMDGNDQGLRVLVLRIGLAGRQGRLELLGEEIDLVLPDLRVAENAGGFRWCSSKGRSCV